jgi:hypothetical protein
MKQYGDKGYVPSNGIGVGGDARPAKKRPAVPLKKLPLKKLPAKQIVPMYKAPLRKQFTPSNGADSKYA